MSMDAAAFYEIQFCFKSINKCMVVFFTCVFFFIVFIQLFFFFFLNQRMFKDNQQKRWVGALKFLRRKRASLSQTSGGAGPGAGDHTSGRPHPHGCVISLRSTLALGTWNPRLHSLREPERRLGAAGRNRNPLPLFKANWG